MAETKVRPFKVKAPCPRCPFRTDVPKYLRPERVQEIADSLYDGAEFPCHQTTESVEHDDGSESRERVATSAFCAGALITMEKEGYSNQMARIGERLGLHDHTDLKMDAPVYDSLAEWVASFREPKTVEVTFNGITEVMEYEHCGVVTEDCEDPPGYAMGGGAAYSTEEPTCHPVEDCCSRCGNPMCTACRSAETTEDGYPQCRYCVNDEGTD